MNGSKSLWPVATALLLGCGAAVDAPPQITYGLEECSFCRMIISEKAYAAAVVSSDGTTRKFDDLGCLMAARQQWNRAGARIWVHDADSGEWLDAADAYYVRQDAATTPMGSGLVALATRAQARRRLGDHESIYDWQELVSSEAALEEN